MYSFWNYWDSSLFFVFIIFLGEFLKKENKKTSLNVRPNFWNIVFGFVVAAPLFPIAYFANSYMFLAEGVLLFSVALSYLSRYLAPGILLQKTLGARVVNYFLLSCVLGSSFVLLVGIALGNIHGTALWHSIMYSLPSSILGGLVGYRLYKASREK